MKEQKLNKNLDNFYNKVADLILLARKSIANNMNLTMVYTYFEVGKMIVEKEQKGKERAEYGKSLLIGLSAKLGKKLGKGFSVDNLENMRKFYRIYSKSETVSRISTKEISETKSAELKAQDTKMYFNLSWSHYQVLMRMKDVEERKFYEIEAKNENWGIRELKRQFNSALYQRLALSRDKKGVKELSIKGQIIEHPNDIIKDPLVIEFTGLKPDERYSETELENRLINKLEYFLLELGKGFTFVARQKRISFKEQHFFIDLVFYNRLLRCFVIVDLKIGTLKHQDIGQLQMYVNYYDRYVKLKDENKTIGIILCRDKSDMLVEITLPENNEQIFASKYETVLPSKDELKKILND